MAILGISLGSRTTGIVVLKNKELLVSRIVTVRNAKTKTHTDTIGHYVKQYKIMYAVIKIPPPTHISDRLNGILQAVLSLLTYHGCMVEFKTANMIKESIPAIVNRENMIAVVADLYPTLAPLHDKESANRQDYHYKMFEAVAIVHIHQFPHK